MNNYEKEHQRRYQEKLERMSPLEFSEYSLVCDMRILWMCLVFLAGAVIGYVFVPDDRRGFVMIFAFVGFCLPFVMAAAFLDAKEIKSLKGGVKITGAKSIKVSNVTSAGWPQPDADYDVAIGIEQGTGATKCNGVAGVKIHGYLDDKGNQEMTIYWQCVKCNHQLAFTGPNYDQKPCPKCGEGTANINFGKKPEWWKS